MGRTFTRVLDRCGEASLVPFRWSSLGTVQEQDAVLRVPLLRSRGVAADGHPYEEEKKRQHGGHYEFEPEDVIDCMVQQVGGGAAPLGI